MSGRSPCWVFRPFLSETDGAEDEKQKKLVVSLWVTLLALSGSTALLWCALPIRDLSQLEWRAIAGMTAYLAAVPLYCLVHLSQWGLTPFLKVFFLVAGFLWLTLASVIAPYGGAEPWYVLLLDLCLALHTDRDRSLLHATSTAVRAGVVAYAVLHCLSESGVGPSIHPFAFDCLPVGKLASCTVPMLVNFGMMRSYALSARQDAHRIDGSVEMASRIAHKLANFDLDGAETLMKDLSEPRQGDVSSPVHAPLLQILRNLRSYQPFLPGALFWQAEVQSRDPPNQVIAQAMIGEETSWRHVELAVQRLREPGYTLDDFGKDVRFAFPELKLYYELEDEAVGSRSCSSWSSGRTGSEEHQRTMGAMFSVYCIARLDIDGKEIFTYGVDAHSKGPRTQPLDKATAEKQLQFYHGMQWSQLTDLFVRANLLVRGSDRRLRTNEYRMTAFLVLTAVHDIMKNTSLLPTVQRRHSPYGGVPAGSVINDHDVALAYVMEYFPGLLPSFHGLEPGQRAPILFSQGKMGFNNGWLVQGEAPPGALFSTFKQVIVHGRASEADISFYFAHWVTDLAGSELFGHGAWPGSEKFVLKFPPKVLIAFLDSFTFVDKLSSKSEVEVMEEYLQSRWLAMGLRGTLLPEDCRVAAMRLVLMAQGFEAEAVKALLQLPRDMRDVVAAEMARTGHWQQFLAAPASMKSSVVGPALLVYYAPALIQKAGASQVSGALQVLAAVYQAARELFPLKGGPAVEQTVVVRIDQLKVLTPEEIMSSRPWHLARISDTDAEAVAGAAEAGAAEGGGPHRAASRTAHLPLPEARHRGPREGSTASSKLAMWQPCLPLQLRAGSSGTVARRRPTSQRDGGMLLGHLSDARKANQ